MTKPPYSEGDVFAVPLTQGGYALGVVARAPKKGPVLLGYFFRDLFSTLPNESRAKNLRAIDAIKIKKFGDLAGC